jgi:hypothetical protein
MNAVSKNSSTAGQHKRAILGRQAKLVCQRVDSGAHVPFLPVGPEGQQWPHERLKVWNWQPIPHCEDHR